MAAGESSLDPEEEAESWNGMNAEIASAMHQRYSGILGFILQPFFTYSE